MPTPHVTPPSNGTTSTWQIGTYNAVNDTWTLVLDLNDRATWFIKSYDLAQPEKKVSRSGNPRTQGERITNERYGNRYISLTLQLRSTTTLAAIDTAIHNLEAALSNTPFMMRFAEAQAAQYSYAIVKRWEHSIPQDPLQRLALVKTSITLVLECEPFFLGDKLYLDNLVVNPGFEAPSGPSVAVFTDTFANTNAYTLVAGSAPSVAANVMTIPNGATVSFGSPAWGAINMWKIRFQYATGLFANFDVHYIDGSNKIQYQVGSGSQDLYQYVGGVSHSLATATTAALTNGNFYWTVITQFPTVPGDSPYVAATLYNDSAGTIGTQVAAVGPVQTFDAVTAISGKMAIEASGAALAIGGNFTAVHQVQLFGPGGWMFNDLSGTATAISSGAWDQSTSNTYPNGPVTSYGAGRITLAPAGTVDAFWANYTGGAPAGTNAIPISAAGNVLAASAYTKSSGLGANAITRLVLQEYDTNGAFLRQTTLQSVTGNQAAWVQLSGTATTGASAAYAAVVLEVVDTNAGASANGTVWFDNVQCYNQTTTGQTTMPYCELRFPQSPAQLLVSGLVGDMPAPASLAFGTYFTNANHTPYSFIIGRRAYATSGAQLVAIVADTNSTGASPVLDSTSYGGMYIKWLSGSSAAVYPPYAFNARPADLQGFVSLLLRMQSSETTGANIAKVTVAAVAATQNTAWELAGNIYDTYMTASVAGLTTQNQWTMVNAGLLPVPVSARSAATDLTQNYVDIGPNIVDANTTPVAMQINWCALMPADSVTVRGQAQYIGTMLSSSFNNWNWYYIEATQVIGNGGLVPITGFSIEATALPNIAHAAGGAGVPPSNAPSGAVSVIPSGNAYLTLDPRPPTNALSVSGVNQLAAVLTDSIGTVLSIVATLSYTPQYLDPR